jgi:hypothetical protein
MFEFSEEDIASIFRFEEYSSLSPRILVWLLYDPEVAGDMFLRNICLSSNYTASQLRRPPSHESNKFFLSLCRWHAMSTCLSIRYEFLYLTWVEEETVRRPRSKWNHEMWEQE